MAGSMRFGRYRTLFRIASGGMAEVFAARLDAEAGFQKLVAVKRVLPILAEDETFTRMFLEEARVAAPLTSAHIVQTLDVGRTEDGAPFLVQELVVGVSLLEVLQAAQLAGERIPLEVALEILVQAATGLHGAHEARSVDGRALELVHRDVSPHNVLVGADGRARLTDFGIARVSTGRLVATETGTVKGKWAYLSPEQAEGKSLDRRSDVFGLGIVAWELLTGQRLFLRETPTATLDAVCEAPVPPLTESRPDASAAVATAVAGALQRDRSRRTANARAFADALRAAARQGGVDLSDRRVAAYLEQLSPPRLIELRHRLEQLVREPTVETLADIDLPEADESATAAAHADAQTELRAAPSSAGGASDALTAPRGIVHADAETVLLRPGRDGGRSARSADRGRAERTHTTVDHRPVIWAHGHWLVPALMALVGLLLGVIAVLLFLLRTG